MSCYIEKTLLSKITNTALFFETLSVFIEFKAFILCSLNIDLPEELFAAYRESYITKDAAKKFSKNIRSHKKPLDDKDYEDLLQEIVVIPSEKVGNKMYEKRYFDYQPAERTDVEMSNEELDMFDEIDSQQDILVESLKNKEKRKARVNNRRLRRNANPTTENGQNLKRSAGIFSFFQTSADFFNILYFRIILLTPTFKC